MFTVNALDASVINNAGGGLFNGFQCTNNKCNYICFGPICRDYTNPGNGSTEFLQCGMTCGWGFGAVGRNGCNGSNCGYWDGCRGNNCGGFYDFRKCAGYTCTSGPFQGFFCKNHQCVVVCRGNICHWNKFYDKQPKCDNNCRTGPYST
ncbi:hypothetical protein ACTXT7_014505 [Hymenolepis weldensis]